MAFDLTQISRGCLLWGRHATWEEGRAGFVASATKEQLIVQYHPGIGNVTNHFAIPVSEAAGGQWEIRWSEDLSEVQGYGMEKDAGNLGTAGDGIGREEGGGLGDIGRINL